MALLVVDANVVAKWYLPESDSPLALDLRHGHELVAPDLLFAEVASVLSKNVRARRIDAADALEIAGALVESSLVEYVPTSTLIVPALELSSAWGCSSYDAIYVALAVRLGGTLVTADLRLVNALSTSPLAAVVSRLGDPRMI